jgi:hypothetical protein
MAAISGWRSVIDPALVGGSGAERGSGGEMRGLGLGSVERCLFGYREFGCRGSYLNAREGRKPWAEQVGLGASAGFVGVILRLHAFGCCGRQEARGSGGGSTVIG